MTALELLRERLLKDKEIFPHYNEYINGILSDIDNELLAMEKEQIIDAFKTGTKMVDVENELDALFNAIIYYKETYESND
jgi:hypothetical protein